MSIINYERIFDIRKSTRILCVVIKRKIDVPYRTVLCEQLSEIVNPEMQVDKVLN